MVTMYFQKPRIKCPQSEFPPERPLLHLGLALLATGDPAPVIYGVFVVRHLFFGGTGISLRLELSSTFTLKLN